MPMDLAQLLEMLQGQQEPDPRLLPMQQIADEGVFGKPNPFQQPGMKGESAERQYQLGQGRRDSDIQYQNDFNLPPDEFLALPMARRQEIYDRSTVGLGTEGELVPDNWTPDVYESGMDRNDKISPMMYRKLLNYNRPKRG